MKHTHKLMLVIATVNLKQITKTKSLLGFQFVLIKN